MQKHVVPEDVSLDEVVELVKKMSTSTLEDEEQVQEPGQVHHHKDGQVIWGFPKIGVPPNHPNFWLGFSIINHPAMGVPP